MTKNVSEWRAEQRHKMDLDLEVRKGHQERNAAYVSEVVAKNIPVHTDTRRNSKRRQIDTTNYESFRESLREAILEGTGAFIDLTCDGCGTRLFDSEPSTLASSPPQFYADCCGCGRRYYLTLDARVHVVP